MQGFPTIMVFGVDKSSPYAYDGARSASAIESFATELVESSAGPVEVTELTGPVWFSHLISLDGTLLQIKALTSVLWGLYRMSWKRSVVLLLFALSLSYQTFSTPKLKEGTSI